MKRKNLLSLFSILICSLFVQGQDWQVFGYEKLGKIADFFDLHFIDSEVGWVVGDLGRMYKTIDGGENWIDQSLSDSTRINEVRFFNSHEGIINTEKGLLITENGGQSWELINNSFLDLFRTSFYTRDVGWGMTKREIYKTEDGGFTWNLMSLNSGYTVFYSIYALSEDQCFIGASVGNIFMTNDGGQNWINYQPLPSGAAVGFFDFLNHEIGYFKGYSKMVKTEDGGVSILESNINTPIGELDMINEEEGWVCNSISEIHKTKNGGQSWELQYANPFLRLAGIQFSEEGKGWIVGENELVLKTLDGGENWMISKVTAPNFNSVEYVNKETSWAVSNEGLIYLKKPDSPVWRLTNSVSEVALNDIEFVNDEIGWIVGNDGRLMYTENSGQSWTNVDLPTANTHLNSINFNDEENGIIIGQGGVVFRTDNGGGHWSLVDSEESINLNEISYADDQNVWIVGDLGTVLRSTDRGVNWQKQNWLNLEKLNSVLFLSNEIGFIISAKGKIYKTRDSGINWEVIQLEEEIELNDLSFFTKDKGVVVGNEGVIYRTEDGGASWKRDKFNIRSNLKSVIFYDEISAWVVGDDGIIYKHVGDITSIKNEIKGSSIDVFPNPFKELVKIKVRDHRKIKDIRVLDISGRLISMIENINSNSFDINTQEFRNGMYIIQLMVEDKVYNHKIVKN